LKAVPPRLRLQGLTNSRCMLWQTLPVLDLSCVSVPPALTLLAPSMHQACCIASVTIRAATPMFLWGGPARLGRLQQEAIPHSPPFKAHDAGHDAAMAFANLSCGVVEVDGASAAASPSKHVLLAFEAPDPAQPTRRLDHAQLHAATSSVNRSLSLVEGPPGTGKTKVSCAIISWWVSNLRRVLACEFCAVHATGTSNAAVDNLAIALVSLGCNVVRLGSPSSFTRSAVHDLLPKKHRDDCAVSNEE